MPVKIIVTRTEAQMKKRADQAVTDAALRIALGNAPTNYGLSQIKAGTMGWTYTFIPR